MTSKVQRQTLIVRLVGDHEVTSQPDLIDLLAAEGIDATQATVSRDLDDIGAVKVRIPTRRFRRRLIQECRRPRTMTTRFHLLAG